jgi:hypothetical protein
MENNCWKLLDLQLIADDDFTTPCRFWDITSFLTVTEKYEFAFKYEWDKQIYERDKILRMLSQETGNLEWETISDSIIDL